MQNKTPGAMSLPLMAAAFFAATLAVHAQNTDETSWQFGVTLPLWAPGIDGDVTLRGVEQDISVDFDQIKDHLDAAFSLNLEARKGKLGLFTGVGYMKFSGDYSSANGGRASSELKFFIGNAGLSYQLIRTRTEHPFALEATAGIRYWHTESDLTIKGPGGLVSLSGESKNDIVDPVIGLRASKYLTRKFHLDFAGDFGGFNISRDTDWTWSAMGALSYDFAKWFSLSAGYQALALDVSDGSGNREHGVDLIFHGVLIAAKFTF